ncbi:hypothetical protein Acid345_2698 [Candidatus Koribacter versatilis Ellin345]|uniref:Uncharacterized protein n=1 Tax=Koribacter versatilis (strain Ellin345) TaxID=204669 RepID=Q1IN51_KORVE|nr:hypothetical protein [Candidatus Koribacter versatilis]ABF41699.1 hypothetical protein Acid345_2698 [Candidatus Koribacter versatilis Ellin345]
MPKLLKSVIGWGIAVLFLALVIRAFTSPIIFRFTDPSAVDPVGGLYVVFSPVRDRAPERIGNGVFKRLQFGECDAFIEKRFCEKEAQFPPTRWTLVDRKEEHDGSLSLHYKVLRRGSSSASWGNVWISVTLQDGEWHPLSYDANY